MIKNYFKVALRNLARKKIFPIINMLGLSVGVACFLLIGLYVLDELRFDRYNQNADRIYRIDNQIKFGDFQYNGAAAPAIMGPVFTRIYQQIAQYVRFRIYGGIVIQKGDELIKEDRVIFADSTLFDVFTLPLVAGNPRTALKEPHSLVITESVAKKYFNSLDAIGKTLLINQKDHYKITGIIKDIPPQSHFHFDFFMSMSELDDSRGSSWFQENFQTYIMLNPGADVVQLEKQMNKSLRLYSAPQFLTVAGISQDEFEKAGNYMHCTLMPLTAIHLHSNISDELGVNGSIQRVYIFGAISVFILLIACINFMNLSTAQSFNRAKEIGVRKVLGGFRSSLIFQFLTESVLMSFASVILATGTAFLVLPLFNQLADKQISASLLFNPFMVSILLLLSMVVGLISGSYPAFYLSSFRPNIVLKGTLP
ncbi:MAG TPA: ABC transporter permease, partial [Puia sp.]|nr:ABC transporter permease [Puia sp.]